MKQTLLNDDAGGGHLDNRQRGRARIINTGGSGGCGGGGGGDGCTGGWRGAGATHGAGVAEALGAVVLLRAVEEAQVELTAGVERHFRREGVRRRGAAQTRAQRLIEFENVHCTGIERTYERSRRRVGGAGGEQRGARRVCWRCYRLRYSAFARARLSILVSTTVLRAGDNSGIRSYGLRALSPREKRRRSPLANLRESRLSRNLDNVDFSPRLFRDVPSVFARIEGRRKPRCLLAISKGPQNHVAAPVSITELRIGRTLLMIIRWFFLISSFNYSTLDTRCITKLVHLTSLG